MTLKRHLKTAFRLMIAMTFVGLAPTALRADEPVTHHFRIEKPEGSVNVGKSASFKITAMQASNKPNKKDESTIKINVTTGGGARAVTKTTETRLNRGAAVVSLTINDVGPAIVQVSQGDVVEGGVFNSVSVEVRP